MFFLLFFYNEIQCLHLVMHCISFLREEVQKAEGTVCSFEMSGVSLVCIKGDDERNDGDDNT